MARSFLFAMALLLQAGQQPAPVQTGAVDGQITDSNTGEPVPNATLHLVPLRYARGRNSSQPQAASQSDGAFHFDGVAAGTYVITAERAGFVPNKLNSKLQLIILTAGQSLTGIVVRLIPEGTISGVVEEENGTPLPGSRVEALAPVTTYGQTSLKLFANTNADAEGRFLLQKLPANSYYLVAEPAAAEKKPSKDGDLVRTIYPRSLDIDGGSTIPVNAGQVVTDISVRVRRTTTFHIRGKVADAATQSPGSNLTLAVSPRGSVDSLVLTKKVTVNANRTFDISGLTPGAYTMRLTGARESGGSHSLLARQDVEIGGGDVNGVVLSITPALTVTGQIHTDASSNTALPATTVTARPLEDVSHSAQGFAKVASDGTFTFANLDPGLYVFQAHPATPGWYVKSITLNQQDVLNKQADLSDLSSARLDVSVSPGAGEVDVTIGGTGADSGTTEAVNTIVLAPETVGPDGSGALFGFGRQNASFSFKNVRPGKYFCYVAQQGDPNLWQNPEFLQAMQGQGIPVEVAESSTQQLQLSVLPLELVEQVAGRVGLQTQ